MNSQILDASSLRFCARDLCFTHGTEFFKSGTEIDDNQGQLLICIVVSSLSHRAGIAWAIPGYVDRVEIILYNHHIGLNGTAFSQNRCLH
ncbi:MAG: hypothetical protein COB66_00780 [Coxiella sp. (in: Bacteria)]|nr:MAG: hypothetical protein COB66_00780 [Coxiella sp. (in: g-proteobacteria)]